MVLNKLKEPQTAVHIKGAAWTHETLSAEKKIWKWEQVQNDMLH